MGEDGEEEKRGEEMGLEERREKMVEGGLLRLFSPASASIKMPPLLTAFQGSPLIRQFTGRCML